MSGGAPSTERSRVLVLARENVLHWTTLYIAAFREIAEVITVGPALRLENLAEQGWQDTVRWRVPNDIISDSGDYLELAALLPEGWRPDFVVGIHSSGPRYRNIARVAVPTAYISVDTWHDPEEFKQARGFDAVFCAQRAFAEYLREGGVPRAEWLPLGCSPAHHFPVEQPPVHDFSFAGIAFFKVNRQRVARMRRLGERYDVGMYGALGGEDYCRALASGKAVFNSSVAQDVNMRVFEVMACGRPLFTNRDAAANGLEELFEEGRHYWGYDDDDLMAQAERLMTDDALRETLAENARVEVLAKHTYRHRAEAVLDTLLKLQPDKPSDTLLREGARLADHLPFGVRTFYDIGMGLERSRVSLRHAGVERVIGVPLDAAGAAARAGRYDAVLTWPLPEGTPHVDAVVSAHPMRQGLGLPDLVAGARTVLGAGGELLLLVSAADAEACGLGADASRWDAWLYEQRFHLILFHAATDAAGEPVLLVRGRHYRRDLLDISTEIFERFPGGDIGPLE
ncbi:MAG: glycosyltransferase [Candidatus Hydrogenedens sp.]|nr:glycosyltransferase [Candidatus Hydrogenedens sp.]